MRAFVLKEAGQAPVVGEFEDPVAQAGQEIVKVLAAGLNPVDRYMSMSAEPVLPRVVGLEGVGTLADGKRVYFERATGPYGSVAERSVTTPEDTIILPDGLDGGVALTLGISGLAGWLPLAWKARLQPGENVLILGATGAQGQLAVQAAKLLGAANVVAAGRNREVLESLREHGADEIAVLEGDLSVALKQAAPKGGYQVVIDSLFGEPFSGLLGSGTLGDDSRVVVLGGSAGQEITLGFRQLQSTRGATFAGYSTFYVPKDVKHEAYLQMAEHALAGKLTIAVKSYPLEQAAQAWAAQAAGPHHKIVIVP